MNKNTLLIIVLLIVTVVVIANPMHFLPEPWNRVFGIGVPIIGAIAAILLLPKKNEGKKKK